MIVQTDDFISTILVQRVLRTLNGYVIDSETRYCRNDGSIDV